MHDTPVRMVAKGVLHGIVPWAQARLFLATRLRRRYAIVPASHSEGGQTFCSMVFLKPAPLRTCCAGLTLRRCLYRCAPEAWEHVDAQAFLSDSERHSIALLASPLLVLPRSYAHPHGWPKSTWHCWAPCERTRRVLGHIPRHLVPARV